MPLPALILPLSITAASAIVQLGGKLQARRKIQEAQRRLETRRQQHSATIADLRRRQDAAKARAISGNLAIPSALLRAEPHTYEPPDAAPSRWPAFLSFLRFGQPVLGSKVQSRKRIIAPKVFSTTASLVHKANPAIAGRLGQFVIGAMPEFSAMAEISAVAGKMASVGGKATLLGGRTATAAAVGPGAIVGRVALVGFTVVGYIISPLLAGLSIYLDVRRVRKARRELANADAAMTDIETQATAQTLELERVTGPGRPSLSAPAPSGILSAPRPHPVNRPDSNRQNSKQGATF